MNVDFASNFVDKLVVHVISSPVLGSAPITTDVVSVFLHHILVIYLQVFILKKFFSYISWVFSDSVSHRMVISNQNQEGLR